MVRTKNASNANSNTAKRKRMEIARAKNAPNANTAIKKRGPIKRMEILPPSESILQESLHFSTKVLRDRYAKVCGRPILQGKNLDLSALERLGIRNEVEVLIDAIGWRAFFEINCAAFIELTREFYTTFQFAKSSDLNLDTPNVIKYRLMGQEYAQSITEFNLSLGVISENDVDADWYIQSKVGYGQFDHVSVWRNMSVDTMSYDPSQSPSTLLKKPEWQYIHRLLSFNYSARKSGSATCSKAELYFIWAMTNDVKINLGYWLADQINAVMEKKKGLILGSVITQLAINHGLLDLQQHSLHKAHENAPLDEKSLERMGVVLKKDGAYMFRSPSRPLPSKEVRKLLKMSNVESSNSLEVPEQFTPMPTMFEVMQKLDQMAQELSSIRADINAYFASQNFHPPSVS